MSRKKYFLILIVLFSCLILFSISSLLLGRYPITVGDFISFLIERESDDVLIKSILFKIRLPRILLSVLVGASMAASGVVFQALFHNPLASPGILGVSAAGSFGASLAILLGASSYLFVELSAFGFGILSVILVFLLARIGRVGKFLMILLAGIIISSFFRSATSVVKYMADPDKQLGSIIFWLLGSFSKANWNQFYLATPFLLGGMVVLLIFRYKMDLLTMGDEEALSLGIDVIIFRTIFILSGTLLVSTSVATCGPIGWIGLVIPHIFRLIVGPGHRYLLPTAILGGAIFTLICDNIARSLSTAEIPIGIITAVLGAPIFAYLLVRKGGSGWN